MSDALNHQSSRSAYCFMAPGPDGSYIRRVTCLKAGSSTVGRSGTFKLHFDTGLLGKSLHHLLKRFQLLPAHTPTINYIALSQSTLGAASAHYNEKMTVHGLLLFNTDYLLC